MERLTLSISNPDAEACLQILDDVEAVAAGVRDRKGQALEARAGYGMEAHGKVKVMLSKAQALRQTSLTAGRSTTKVDEVIVRPPGSGAASTSTCSTCSTWTRALSTEAFNR